jgi:hypothetical protein
MMHRGTQRRPLGRVSLRVTPKAETPCAHGARGRACHRRDVQCSRASRRGAERPAPQLMHGRRACLGSRRPSPYRQAGMASVVCCHSDRLRQARECALQYATRGVLEDYQKAIKTGRGAERLPLASAERLCAASAIMRVVALRLSERRERRRRPPDAKAAQSGLSPLAREVWRQKSGCTLRTVREVALAIGRLGGHLNRTRDGLPGWPTLWHGMNTWHV